MLLTNHSMHFPVSAQKGRHNLVILLKIGCKTEDYFQSLPASYVCSQHSEKNKTNQDKYYQILSWSEFTKRIQEPIYLNLGKSAVCNQSVLLRRDLLNTRSNLKHGKEMTAVFGQLQLHRFAYFNWV